MELNMYPPNVLKLDGNYYTIKNAQDALQVADKIFESGESFTKGMKGTLSPPLDQNKMRDGVHTIQENFKQTLTDAIRRNGGNNGIKIATAMLFCVGSGIAAGNAQALAALSQDSNH